MSETKAPRATVQLGSIVIDGFMLPNGEYRMSLTQTAETVDLGVQPFVHKSRAVEKNSIYTV